MKKSTRELQKEQTRERLMSTAYQLFSKRGISNCRMSDIARDAGVSHGTVFLHFDTQELLIREVVAFYCGKIAERTHELAASCETLREILSAHLEGIREFEPFYTRLVLENRFLPPDAREAWISAQSALSFHFGQVAERALPPRAKGIPLHLLFAMWLGLVHYYLANGDLYAPEGNMIRRYGETWLENYLKMIGTDPGKEEQAREGRQQFGENPNERKD